MESHRKMLTWKSMPISFVTPSPKRMLLAASYNALNQLHLRTRYAEKTADPNAPRMHTPSAAGRRRASRSPLHWRPPTGCGPQSSLRLLGRLPAMCCGARSNHGRGSRPSATGASSSLFVDMVSSWTRRGGRSPVSLTDGLARGRDDSRRHVGQEFSSLLSCPGLVEGGEKEEKGENPLSPPRTVERPIRHARGGGGGSLPLLRWLLFLRLRQLHLRR